MPEARKPTGLEKASTILAPTLNTLIFIMIARQLGAEILGSIALFLSLGACLTLSFDLSRAWNGSGGSSLRAAFHLAFAAAGLILALVGWLAVGCECYIALGLFAAYHGTASAALAIASDGRAASAAGLADSMVRVTLLSALLTIDSVATLPWVAAIFAAGGIVALAAAASRPAKVSLASARSEFSAVSGGALAFSILIGLTVWVDKPLLYLLDGQLPLGLYFAVQRTVVFIGAAGVVITGMVSDRFGALPKAEGTRLVTLMERYASLCVIPMAAFYLAFSEPLVNTFFGPAYSASHELIYPLAMAGLFMALASPSVSWLANATRWGELSAAAAVALALMLLIPYALLESGALSDPSTAVAIGCAVSCVVFYAAVRAALLREGARLHGHIPKHVACGAAMAVALHWTSTGFYSIGFGELVFLAMAGVLIYGLLLYLFGEFMQGEYGEFKTLRGL